MRFLYLFVVVIIFAGCSEKPTTYVLDLNETARILSGEENKIICGFNSILLTKNYLQALRDGKTKELAAEFFDISHQPTEIDLYKGKIHWVDLDRDTDLKDNQTTLVGIGEGEQGPIDALFSILLSDDRLILSWENIKTGGQKDGTSCDFVFVQETTIGSDQEIKSGLNDERQENGEISPDIAGNVQKSIEEDNIVSTESSLVSEIEEDNIVSTESSLVSENELLPGVRGDLPSAPVSSAETRGDSESLGMDDESTVTENKTEGPTPLNALNIRNNLYYDSEDNLFTGVITHKTVLEGDVYPSTITGVINSGRKDKVWKYLDNNGVTRKIENYFQGKLGITELFDPKGNLTYKEDCSEVANDGPCPVLIDVEGEFEEEF